MNNTDAGKLWKNYVDFCALAIYNVIIIDLKFALRKRRIGVMITKSIIKAAEKAVPFEEKLIAFFSKKAVRLISLGAIAVVCSLIFWNYDAISSYDMHSFKVLLFVAVIYLAITAAAGFLSNIGKFSLIKYTVMVLIASVVHFFGNYVFATSCIDATVENALGLLLNRCLDFASKIYIPAMILSLLTGLMISRKRI